jgi:hypothetical protein
MRLLEVEKIWDHGDHNAFTDLIHYKGQFYCTFREGEDHYENGKGIIRILQSEDANKWQSVGQIRIDGIDLRDPYFFLDKNEKLALGFQGGRYINDQKHLWMQSYVAFPEQGNTIKSFSDPAPLNIKDEWFWRILCFEEKYYSITYSFTKPGEFSTPWKTKFYQSENSIEFSLIDEFKIEGRPNEAALRILPDGRMGALLRRDKDNCHNYIGRAERPFEQWEWRELNCHIGGPNFLPLTSTEWIASGRRWANHGGKADPETHVGMIYHNKFESMLTLPSGGDCSYPGLVLINDRILYVSYYSSHEGKTNIYLAKIQM